MRQRTIIWFAIVMSTVIYLYLAYTFSGELGDFEQSANQPMVLALYLAALGAFVMAWFVVPRVVKGNAQQRMVVTISVFEACAIFGLVAAFLHKDWRLYLFPWALAIVGFLRERPREQAAI